MKQTDVLVITRQLDEEVREALYQCGYVPVVAGAMPGILDKVRHRVFAAIVVDANAGGPTGKVSNTTDALEIVLNIRDLDEETPILVLGKGWDAVSRAALKQQNRLVVTNRPASSEALRKVIDNLVNIPERRDVQYQR